MQMIDEPSVKDQHKNEVIQEFLKMKKAMFKKSEMYDTELSIQVLKIQDNEKTLKNITKHDNSWRTVQHRIAFLSRLRRLISEARMFGLKLT